MTKEQIMEALEKIANEGNKTGNGFVLAVKAVDWKNYGKDRTYFEIIETRNNSKHTSTKKYGFYDNQAGRYVGDERLFNFTFSGASFAN